MDFSLFWKRLGSQNHAQHKPDSTWNGKRRLFFCVPPVCFVSRRKPLGMVLDRKASPKLLNAPLASLAALARSLRSSTVVSYR